MHDVAAALERGDITAAGLCEQLIERMRSVDPGINAFRHFHADQIMALAEASDDRRGRGETRGRFDGVPVAVKDNIAVTDQECGCASRILEGFVSTYDATVVARLKEAGIICFGRTNMDEFAMGSSTEQSAYGVTRNPCQPQKVAGGSSGGSAAAVASGMALAALGTDTGGSIRQPASFCGVVGMKPTYGRVSRYGIVAYASSLDQVGPITADVRDSAILLDIIGGRDDRDATSLPDAAGGFEAALDATDPASLTVGVPREYMAMEGLADDVRRTLEDTMARLEKDGATIVEISLPHAKYAVATYYVIATAEASSNLAKFDGIRYGRRRGDDTDLMNTYVTSRSEGFGMEAKRRIILGTYVLSSGYYDAYYLRAQKVRTLVRRDFEQAFEKCDVILGPVSPITAYNTGADLDPLSVYLADIYTIPANLAGLCAISVPVDRDKDGLPIGMQVMAAPLAETKLLQAAACLESERDAL